MARKKEIEMARKKEIEENVVYCICPRCKTIRKKIKGRYTIVKRGKERNGIARFFCKNCGKWFNEHTGDAMQWFKR